MGYLEERNLDDVPTIPEYYKGKSIFITGGTGFMGKVLIEKLLYSCSDLDKIYLLIRSKRGVSPENRLNQLYAIPCFDRLRKERPGIFESKVYAVTGDVSEIGLGMSEEDKNTLIKNVHIIFHSAASVRFNDSLTKAIKLNLRGTKELVNLALKMEKLESFVHVSTTYANTNRDPIEEVMYPPHADYKDTLEVCENIDEQTLNVLTAKYLGDMPNTYVFTKQLAENLIYEHRGKLPVIIIRPSVVVSSVTEPIPGWMDNFNGPVGVLVGGGKGIIRIMFSDEDVVVDYIPVDLSIKHIIAAAWIRGTKKLEQSDNVEIYNCCNGNIRAITNGQVSELGKMVTREIPFEKILWVVESNSVFTKSKFYYNISNFFLQVLPAIFVDMLLWIAGKKPLLVKIQRKIYTVNLALKYYMLHQWSFSNENFLALRACIKEQDRTAFYYDIEGYDYYTYLKTATLACKQYLLKENVADLTPAKRNYNRVLIEMGFLEDRDLSNVPAIKDFYRGKTIFITGGSGFLGKVLVEKLLYSCSDLDRIYLLMRSKKGVNPEQRLTDLYSFECFNRLREERPGLFEKKVFFIAGDVGEIGLGLSEEDRALLVNRVNIVFHSAASVRFDDTLPVAAKLNLRGTKEILDLASDMRNLVSLIHVSTSYANTNRDPIEEVVYPPHADWRDTLKVCETMDEHTVKVFTPKYLGDLPNTYVFTKQLAEHVVSEYKGKLPIVIARPSIVISSHLEPMPGWVDNFNGPNGLIVASGKGILRTVYSNPELVQDYIPVDIVVKGLVAAAWIRGTKELEPTDDIPVYHCCANKLNCMSLGELVEIGSKFAAVIPLDNMVWNVGGAITTSKFVYRTKVYLLHLLPALLIDTILWLAGMKTMLVRLHRRIYTANMALNYYLTQQWTFSNTNFISLRSAIKREDKSEFYYEIENIDKYEYFKAGCLGGRKYLMKEKDEDIPKARAHYQRILILEKIIKCIFYCFVIWKLINNEFVKSLFENLCGLIY